MKVSDRRVSIDYTNWRGMRSVRVVEPVALFFGANEWHKERQWLMIARDETGVRKTFALKDIHRWEVVG